MRNVLGTNTCTCIDIYRLRHLPLESMLYRLQQVGWLVWLVVLGIYVGLAVFHFQSYRDLEAGENQSLKFKWRDRESNPGSLAPQAKSLTTRPPPLPTATGERNLKMLAGYLPFY